MSKIEIPDPLLHRNISFCKSGIRIIAGLFFICADISLTVGIGGALIVVSEVLGIIEELV